jgi:hypothetical protein
MSGFAGNKNDRYPYKRVGGQTYDRDPVIYYLFSVTQLSPTDGAVWFYHPEWKSIVNGEIKPRREAGLTFQTHANYKADYTTVGNLTPS